MQIIFTTSTFRETYTFRQFARSFLTPRELFIPFEINGIRTVINRRPTHT